MSSFFTAHQHILGYLVPYNDVEDTMKETRYDQGNTAGNGPSENIFRSVWLDVLSKTDEHSCQQTKVMDLCSFTEFE